MWILPVLIIGLSAALSFPLGLYLFRVLDRREATGPVERLLDTGGQDWMSYCLSLVGFNALAVVVGYCVLALQQSLPLNPESKGALAPSTIFNTCCSFLTNTNLQHYAGEVHL